MEVIGVLQTVGGLIANAKTVLEYLNDVKDASQERAKLLLETQATMSILWRLEIHARQEDWKGTLGALAAPGGPFEQLAQELFRMQKKLSRPADKWAQQARSLLWYFSKQDINAHLVRIERLKSLFGLALNNNLAFAPCYDLLISGHL
jgi:hypothetical protein